jgi:ABC-type phosphate/phosphonate transport system substrate-binding protein
MPELPDFERQAVPEQVEAGTLFTQVCGWPLQTIFSRQASIVGVPVYDAAHCAGPYHCGVFVVARDAGYASLADLRGRDFVFNSVHSNSGMNLPRRAVAELAEGKPFFGSVRLMHGHPGNLELVAAGEADATCVDCVTWSFFARHRPVAAGRLRVLAATPPSPAIPFVTAVGTAPELRAILAEALIRVGRAPEWAAARAGLLLRDIVAPEAVDYRILQRYEAEAARMGYPVLR